MKNFISAADIDDLADQGVRELTVDEDTVLTAVARETAAQRGVKLVAPGAASRPAAQSLPAQPSAAVVNGKPKGCQHGPISTDAGSSQPAASGTSPVVDELIGAVKQLAHAPQGR